MPDIGRKKRSDALRLSDEVSAWLADALLAGLSLEKARDLLASEHQIKVSTRWVSKFYQEECGPRLLQRYNTSAKVAGEFEQEAVDSGALNKSSAKLIAQRLFELASNPLAKASDFKSFANFLLKIEDQRLKDRALADQEERTRILRQKAERADEAEQVVRDESLTPEQRQARFREIFNLPATAPANA